ncbi:MAG: topoisomerase DNA-binding C4 zinc finger domain-containing protein [Desulfitobacteriaceae bacterium]
MQILNLYVYPQNILIKKLKTALTGFFDRPQENPVVQSNNETVLCPKCSIPMVLRKSTKGQNAGREFYGCTNYPQCKQVQNSGHSFVEQKNYHH